jgi:hypothetical protein
MGGTEAEHWQNMVQARAWWPEQPQTQQRIGSQHLRTLCHGNRCRDSKSVMPMLEGFRFMRGEGSGKLDDNQTKTRAHMRVYLGLALGG